MNDMEPTPEGMKAQIMLGHPGRQHSHLFARGLADVHFLGTYCSGQFHEKQLGKVPRSFRRFLPSAVVRNAVPFMGKNVSVTRSIGTIVNYLSRKVSFLDARRWGEWAGFALYDWQLSRLVANRKPRVLIGYEMACLQSFEIAKRFGAICILDAAACHHNLQDLRVSDVLAHDSRVARLIRGRKDGELEMADLVICSSPLSAQSYIDAGISASKIVVNLLGVSTDTFAHASVKQRNGPIQFIYIANSRVVKGADYVESAISDLQRTDTPSVVHIVGGAQVNCDSGGSVNVIHHGHLSHQSLAGILGSADCLLLPSRLESFGMVVLEAMASGVPVVVSNWVGAAALVNQGVDGWKFGETLEDFVRQVRWCADNVNLVRAMRPDCVQTALRNSWEAYQVRAVDIVKAAMRDH